jgi:hypothetical protein
MTNELLRTVGEDSMIKAALVSLVLTAAFLFVRELTRIRFKNISVFHIDEEARLSAKPNQNEKLESVADFSGLCKIR